MTNLKIKLSLGILMSGLMLSIGCSSNRDGAEVNEDPGLDVIVTDAPLKYGEIESANITFGKITATNDASGESVTISSEEKTVDLCKLRNGLTELLAGAKMPSGTYSELVVQVVAGTVTLRTGVTHDLEISAAVQDGMRIKLEQPIGIGSGRHQLLLDIDLTRSLHRIANYKLNPDDYFNRLKLYQPKKSLELMDAQRVYQKEQITYYDSRIAVKSLETVKSAETLKIADSTSRLKLADSSLYEKYAVSADLSPKLALERESAVRVAYRYIFRPHFRAVNRDYSAKFEGVLTSDAGTTYKTDDDTPLGGVTVTAYRDGVAIASTVSNEETGYYHLELPQGSYEIVFSEANHLRAATKAVALQHGNAPHNQDVLMLQND